jgi:hypothetical protein
MFQFPRLPPYRYGLAIRYWVMKPSGLPHSEIPGYGCTHLTEAYRSVATSFIGSRRQGIHPARVLVCDLHRPGLRSPARALPGRTEPEEAELVATHRRRPGEARTRYVCDQRACAAACGSQARE